MACARRAAGYGAKVAIVEGKEFGGTCVNVGCVPKKIMYNAAHVAETIDEATSFSFVGVPKPQFNWGKMKENRDRYIGRLNKIYEDGMDKLSVTRIKGYASFDKVVVGFDDPNSGFDGSTTIRIGDKTVQAKHIVIAVGGAPNKLGVPGEELVIDSDGFFALSQQPKKAGVIGAGYIAVEIAGVFNGLGTDTSLFVRGDKALRQFDPMISEHLDKEMQKSGVNIHPQSAIKKITKEEDGTMSVHLINGKKVEGFDCLLAATGRHPATQGLDLEKAGVIVNKMTGYIEVDNFQNTAKPNIYALGDVCGQVELTPMAVAAGRRLADRVFGGMPSARVSYENVPTVVFSHPVIGTCGLTEPQAAEIYGSHNLKIYTSSFVNLYYGIFFEGGPGDKAISKYKLICAGPEEKVVGLHMIGRASDEVLQGFGVAMKMGATKADFDACIAIHPTAAEEMVTLAPWGMSGAKR